MDQSIACVLVENGAKNHPKFDHLLITETAEVFDMKANEFIKKQYFVNSQGIVYPYVFISYINENCNKMIVKKRCADLLWEAHNGKLLTENERIYYKDPFKPVQSLLTIDNLCVEFNDFKIPRNANYIQMDLDKYKFHKIHEYGVHKFSNLYFIDDPINPMLLIRNKGDYYLIRMLKRKNNDSKYWKIHDDENKPVDIYYSKLVSMKSKP